MCGLAWRGADACFLAGADRSAIGACGRTAVFLQNALEIGHDAIIDRRDNRAFTSCTFGQMTMQSSSLRVCVPRSTKWRMPKAKPSHETNRGQRRQVACRAIINTKKAKTESTFQLLAPL
jgi:hypothetical protein